MLLCRLEVIERGSDVVVLGLEPVQPFVVLVPQMRLRLFHEFQDMLSVAPRISHLAARLEPLQGELTDRLVHPVPVVGAANEALLDERRERVEICARHLLSSQSVAPPAKPLDARTVAARPGRAGRATTRWSNGASAGADRRRDHR